MGFARNNILFCLNANARDTCINVALTVLYRYLGERTMNLSLVLYGNESGIFDGFNKAVDPKTNTNQIRVRIANNCLEYESANEFRYFLFL